MRLARSLLWDDIWYAIRFLDRIVGLIRTKAMLPMDLRLAKVSFVRLFFVACSLLSEDAHPWHYIPKPWTYTDYHRSPLLEACFFRSHGQARRSSRVSRRGQW